MHNAANIDQIMDRASEALVQTRYFDTVDLCHDALTLAWDNDDFDRFARTVLPLLEARRQIRQHACDAAVEGGIQRAAPDGAFSGTGLYLVEGDALAAATLRAAADRSRTPAFVIAADDLPPGTDAGAITNAPGEAGVRAFQDAAERIGDALIASAEGEPGERLRVETLWRRLQRAPEHEKLHQRLEEAARAIARAAPVN